LGSGLATYYELLTIVVEDAVVRVRVRVRVGLRVSIRWLPLRTPWLGLGLGLG